MKPCLEVIITYYSSYRCASQELSGTVMTVYRFHLYDCAIMMLIDLSKLYNANIAN